MRATLRCAFCVGGDGEIARDGEAGAGLVRDRRRGRRKGVRQGRKQRVLEARSRAPQNDYVFEWEEERRSLSTRYYTAFHITSLISIPLILAKIKSDPKGRF